MNNKGRFKEDNSGENKFKLFFKESGFYIALVVGLCALAAGAVFFSTNQILTDPEPTNHALENGLDEEGPFGIVDFTEPDFQEPDQSYISDITGSEFAEEGPYAGLDGDVVGLGDEEEPPVVGHAEPAPIEEEAKAPKTASNEDQQAQSASANVTAIGEDEATQDVVLAIVRPSFQQPVSGKIQSAYSMDKLVFSPTFNEWRTHSGVDLAVPRGEVVRSIGNGTILEVKNDPRYGFTVVIDHKNGYKSLYANLVSDTTIQIGKEIKVGDPVGTVGATAIFESAEPTHLHFELYKENKLVDPAAYIDLAK